MEEKRLKDQIKWEPGYEDKRRGPLVNYPEFVKPIESQEPEGEDHITIPGDPVVENPVAVVTEKQVNVENVFRRRARRFMDLIAEGKKPAEAANDLHVRLGDLMADKHVKERVKEAIETWHLDDKVRKLLVRAVTNQLLVEGKDSDNVAEKKLALEAAKLIAADPDVGLQQQGPIVQIDLGALGNLLQQPAPVLPGIDAPRENNLDKVLDIEPEV